MSSFAKCIPLALLCACGVNAAPLQVASPDADRFATEAYPILLRDCGFPACHGATDRFFRIYGPGRTRLSPDMKPDDEATAEEIQQSYDRTRSMIDVQQPKLSLLLRKPLASSVGGSGHKGKDSLGRNVYLTLADPDYQTLRAWVLMRPSQVADAGTMP